MNHLMLDLETSGTAPGCVVRSLGAVVFDPEAGTIGRRLYFNIDRQSCLDAGLTEDPETMAWWAQQGPEAQAALLVDPAPLDHVIGMFGALWDTEQCKRLWCHGATFDAPVWEAAIKAARRLKTWDFRDVRDTRTVFELAGVRIEHSPAAIKHHAGDDAQAQAVAVIRSYQRLSRSLGPGVTGVVDLLAATGDLAQVAARTVGESE